ncbi:MAG: hypothetical protein RIG84_12950 [Roseovarius sp.]
MADYLSISRRFGVLFILSAGLALAGCAKKEERVLFNGKYYPTKEKAANKSDRKEFVVTVRRANQGEPGARAAGEHGGQRYCLTNYGTSEIEWIVGPEAPAGTFDVSKGSIALRGTCILW